MKLTKLTFAQLVREMHAITKSHTFYTQRDTLLDVAELHEDSTTCPADGFSRKWGVRDGGTWLGLPENKPADYAEHYTEEYTIRYVNEDWGGDEVTYWEIEK